MANLEVKPVTLTGRHVHLEPMTEAHVPGLTKIGAGQAFWDFMVYGNVLTEADMANWVGAKLRRKELAQK